LTAIQKQQYYRAILERNFTFLTKGSNTVPNLLNTMMELRKCCNHPFLIADADIFTNGYILEDYLCMKGYLYERIDGQVHGTLRQAAIDGFSKPEYDRFVFLLCTRARGLGINLTAANTVIIYDSDWNPQNDIQAQARCVRIRWASLKLGLDKAVLQSMNTQQQASGPPQLSKSEIENLLKRGAYSTIMDSDDAANHFSLRL
uniref:Helicase C-terminal domain-containing protein n=1 Tax=Amphimedon queenslandica TaxID=400682 RepID=A0A1X7TGY8_AMPQE